MKWIKVEDAVPMFDEEVIVAYGSDDMPVNELTLSLGYRIREDGDGHWWETDIASEIDDVRLWSKIQRPK